MEVMEINEVFDYSEEIKVYKEGAATAYTPAQEPFKEITVSWKAMLEGSHSMPAYGVSLNGETLKQLQKGLWVEFVFGKQMEHNGMPFEKLLIQVDKNFYGFNLIRYNTGYGYDGRCFYIDLGNKTMSDFYNVLIEI